MEGAKSPVESPVAAFEQVLTCTQCSTLFDDPVLLPCAHVFCRACTVDASECAICSMPFFAAEAKPSPMLRSLLAQFVVFKRRLDALENGELAVSTATAHDGEPPSTPQLRDRWWRAYCDTTTQLDACERLLREDDPPSADVRGALAHAVEGLPPCDERECAFSRHSPIPGRARGPPPARGKVEAEQGPALRRALADGDTPGCGMVTPAARAGKRARSVPSSFPAEPEPAAARAVVLLASSLSDESAGLVKLAAKSLSGVTVERAWSRSVTHIITEPIDFAGKRLGSRTYKHLCGILCGQWIVGSAWLRDSLERGECLAEEGYELDGDMTTSGQYGPRKGRAAHAAGASAIFAGLHVYLHAAFSHPNPSKPQLLELLSLGGASVCASFGALQNEAIRGAADRRALALCDADAMTAEFCTKCVQLRIPILSPKWLMDSISHVTCLDIANAHADYRLDTAFGRAQPGPSD